MSCSISCVPSCGLATPAPLADTWNEPCVRQSPISEVVFPPSPVAVILPGAILSPTIDITVGSVVNYFVVGGYGGGPGGFQSNGGHRGDGGYGLYRGNGSYRGYGGCGNYGLYRSYGGYVGYGSCGHGDWHRGHRYLSGNCGPC